MSPLEKLMKRTDKVHLKSPGTDLTFSIKGIGAKMCKGDAQHSRRRSVFLPGERFRERRDSVQHPDALFGNEV
jgi:leucyl aminopeptidase (aminopeptidase T)